MFSCDFIKNLFEILVLTIVYAFYYLLTIKILKYLKNLLEYINKNKNE